MSSHKLPNHVRRNRKLLGLSQDEVAFLLGKQSGAYVCRFEQFLREPSLETALALEAVFDRPASELFPGIYHRIEVAVAMRAKTLAAKPVQRNHRTAKRLRSLAAIAERPLKKSPKFP